MAFNTKSGSNDSNDLDDWGHPYSYGHLSVISTYNPIYRMYNPIEITSYNWFLWP